MAASLPTSDYLPTPDLALLSLHTVKVCKCASLLLPHTQQLTMVAELGLTCNLLHMLVYLTCKQGHVSFVQLALQANRSC